MKNGGPAFPADPNWISPKTVVEGERIASGMSLRDYFAAKAMQGLCANNEWLQMAKHRTGDALPQIADAAYEVADAMLAERDK